MSALANGRRMLRVQSIDATVTRAGAVTCYRSFCTALGDGVLSTIDLDAPWRDVERCRGIERGEVRTPLGDRRTYGFGGLSSSECQDDPLEAGGLPCPTG